ncbi:hypothetical protein N866_17025 [Actinotalea ferrariae CF5-4]|uniref:Permease n=1 Tax=Actinotalea ferrariae CF5-4 TaxID=948458 RepID=A0A021VV69_9CELL|nr:hypothetical protein [Actinotalea ferrariae]EYR63930.1 hypothetical protein N866_17025 [Actinotalea ferrariae CF5-4]
MDVSTRAVLTAAIAAGVAAAAFVGQLPLVVVAGLLTVLLALGWPVLLDLPNPLGSGVVIALVGLGSVLAVTVSTGATLLWLVPTVVALGVLLAFVAELLRQDGRLRLVESVTGTVTGLLVVSAASGWVAALRAPGDTALVITGAAALAVSAAVSAVHLGVRTGALVTTAAGVITGAAVGSVMPGLSILPGLALGFATGLLVAALHVLLAGVGTLCRFLAAVAAVVLPVLLGGILVYVVGRVLVG